MPRRAILGFNDPNKFIGVPSPDEQRYKAWLQTQRIPPKPEPKPVSDFELVYGPTMAGIAESPIVQEYVPKILDQYINPAIDTISNSLPNIDVDSNLLRTAFIAQKLANSDPKQILSQQYDRAKRLVGKFKDSALNRIYGNR